MILTDLSTDVVAKKENYIMNHGCRKCRREATKLFLKGERCFSPKCAVATRPFPPGQHGPSSYTKLSEYGKQLREKQKVKNGFNLKKTIILELQRIMAQPELKGSMMKRKENLSRRK